MQADLVIWTLNSERYLRQVLKTAESRIPGNVLQKKIMVDGGSADQTVRIGKELGWETYTVPKGIPRQANYALSKVEAPFFCSIEHDLLLGKDWWNRISPYMLRSEVAVAQGIQIPTHPVLAAFDKFLYAKEHRDPNDYGISIDNNLYRTEFIREIGGFPLTCKVAVDRELRDEVEKRGKQWIIDPNVHSLHIRQSLLATLLHDISILSRIRRESELVRTEHVFKVVTVPLQCINILKFTKEPRLVPYLVANRLSRIIIICRRYGEIRRAKMLAAEVEKKES